VDLWNELSASGDEPLSAPITQTASVPSVNLDSVRKQWLDSCLMFNENIAEQVLNQAFALYPLEAVCIEVLQKGLVEMGNMWYLDKVTIQQEHFASALAHRRLDALIAATPPPTRPEAILIGCAPKDQHTFTPLLLTLLLRRRGLKVVYLGANVPNQRFQETLLSIKSHLVVLSAQLLKTANELRDIAGHLTASGARVAYGGRIFNLLPEIRNHIPAHFLGESIQEAIPAIETLLSSDIPLSKFEPVSKNDTLLSESFARSKSLVETYALTEAKNIYIPTEIATEAIQQLGENLVSSLSFGKIDLLSTEMAWTEGLLREHNQNIESLGDFLVGYAKSVDAAMGEEGQLISSWLRAQAF